MNKNEGTKAQHTIEQEQQQQQQILYCLESQSRISNYLDHEDISVDEHFVFLYRDDKYKIYKDSKTIFLDLNYQIEMNYGKKMHNCLFDLVDYYWNIRETLLMPVSKIFGYNILSTSFTRLFPTKATYISFISEAILDITTPGTSVNFMLTLITEYPEFRAYMLDLKNHRTPTILKAYISQLNMLGYATFLQRPFLRYINSNYDYFTSINKHLLQENYSDISNKFLIGVYKMTFVTQYEYASSANPFDYLLFIMENVRVIVPLAEQNEVSEDPLNIYDVCLYKQNYYTDSIRIILHWVFEYITGRKFFVLSGGESNPGPIFNINQWIKDFLIRQFGPTYSALQEAGELAVLSAHLMRLFTSISDALASFMTGRAVAPIDFTCRISSLILSAYESHQHFAKRVGFRLRPTATGQSGPFENVLISAVLAYGAPQFIKDLMRDVPKFTSTKILDDATWFYELFGFIISIPRRVLSLFEDDKHEGIVSIITQLLLGVEDLFPFSNICRIKREMEIMLKVVDDDPTYAICEVNQNKILELNIRRKKIEETYKNHRKNFPAYYVNTSETYDALCVKVFKYKSDVRVEPVCIVIKGPKGTGKTVMMNRIIQMYKNAGMRVYTDNIPAALENKKFYDTYDDEEIYTVDDVGAKSKAQWSEIINMVSSAKYPLNAANIKNKDTKFFNSQLMLLTCNIMPSNFSASDGVADKEAFYRRIVMFDFGKVSFTGQYTGKIEVKQYDDTLGVQSFVTKKTFEVSETTGEFSMRQLDEFISGRLQEKMDIYEENKRTNLLYTGRPFPVGQSLATDILQSFDDMIANMPGIDWIVGQMYDLMAKAMDNMNEYYRTHAGSLARVMEYKHYIMFMTFAVAAGGLAIYYKMTEKSEQETIIEKTHLEYKSNRGGKKTTLKKLIGQGFQNLDGTIAQPVPQLIPYQNNMCRTTYHFQDFEGKSRTVKMRTLFSVDKMLTVYHPFDIADKDKPIYVTASVGENIIYDYMEIYILTASATEDWVIFRLPETAPKYMKKIKYATTNTSFKLYLATGDSNIIDMKDSIGQYTYGVDYTYDDYVGKLTNKDFTYDVEGDGMCGSLLLTKDGRMLGIHVAGLEYYDERENVHRKGIAKIFNQNSYDFIMGVLALSTTDKTNLEFEVKDRNISGVYVNTKDKCYGVEGTRYVKSPIFGVFPVYRKPALELPKEKQDYKTLTEAMMLPVNTVNLEALEFSEKVLEQVSNSSFQPFKEEEIVNGNGVLKRINPSTSTGHSLKQSDKHAYLNYENGKLTDELIDEMKVYTDKICNNEYKFEDAATVVSKDELKDVIDPEDPNSMPKKIRIFTNYHLISTILFRYFFGNLMAFVMEHRNENGIMIGLNPLSYQWDKFARQLTSIGKQVFDGDYANYDKNMHPAFQRRLNAWLVKSVVIDSKTYNKIFKTNYNNKQVKQILDQILECIISTPIISKNKKFITTHGLPSGTAMTAFYNSCINKMYTAYVYRMVAPSQHVDIHTYFRETILYFYGDDIIGNISSKIRNFYNPMAFSRIMKTLGLDFTPAEKGVEWNETNQFKPLEQCTFLKRTFFFHPKLKQIVAPLNIKSLEGTMNYVTDGGRSVELIMDKMYNFQREIYLHPGEAYHVKMRKLLKACEDKNIRFTPLNEDYLIKCYSDNTYADLLELN